MAECGSAIEVIGLDGGLAVRFVAQCGGRFMVISNMSYQRTARNGNLLAGWRDLVRELVALTVPRSLAMDKAFDVAGVTGGLYRRFRLTYPLSVSELAGLVGESADDVRALLADLAVQAE